MANTYYDSALTAAEIEAALEAIDGLIAPVNNGKVIAVENGTLVAKSTFEYSKLPLQSKTVTPGTMTRLVEPDIGYGGLSSVTVVGDADLVSGNIKKDVDLFGVIGSYEGDATVTLISKTITQNGTYNASDDSADGYSQVVVAVSDGGGDSSDAEALVDGTLSYYANSNIFSVRLYAFTRLSALTEVYLPACTNIGMYAFYSCPALKIASFPNVTEIGYMAFGQCTTLSAANFPLCTTMSESIFAYCSSLATVSFPVCQTIGSFAFDRCTSLRSVSFPACTSISVSAFRYCSSLATVSFPACTSLGNYAFYECHSLTTASFPACTRVGLAAFFSCYELMSVYFLGSSVPSLPNVNAFGATPISNSSYTGAFGSIFVLPSMVDAFKSATNWSMYADRITAYIE